VLVGILVVAFAFHHLGWVLIGLLIYLVVVRRFIHRDRWSRYHGRPPAPWR
jgi:hypothetical protein